MSAQALVNRGLCWRIGNVEQVQVWGDKWLPTPFIYRVTSLRMFMCKETKVCELINRETASWKKDVIDVLFLPHEAEEIKRFPLSAHLFVDRQICACSPNGMFTVCNAYSVAMEMAKANNGFC